MKRIYFIAVALLGMVISYFSDNATDTVKIIEQP